MRALTAFVSVSLIGLSAAAGAAETCDRACLSGLLTQYVDALGARDPSTLPVTTDVRKSPKIPRPRSWARALWKTVTGKATFRQDYIDTRKQIAAAHLVLPGRRNLALIRCCCT